MILSLYPLTSMMMLSILHIASVSTSTLENKVVTRYIQISTQLVAVNTKIRVVNEITDPINSYVYIVDPQWVEHLSYIEALDSKNNRLTIDKNSRFDDSEKTMLQYTILFPKPIHSGETTDISVLLVLTNYLKSYPKSVKQNEKHLVLFSFNIYYYSVYLSQTQTTYLYLGTTNTAVIDGEMYKIANESQNGLQYGPYFDTKPFENYQTTLHYENNSPFLVAEKVNRYVKLSHWGYISVWDQIQLVHSGPKFTGPFKREVHTNHQDSKKDSAKKDTRIEGFVSTLPSNAFDIYLKDEIGLIWDFEVNYDDPNSVAVSVEPRYILYGGWKIDYEIGYSLPISDYVTVKDSEYFLSFPLMDIIYPNMIVKDLDVKIILPEGASFEDMDMGPCTAAGNNSDTDTKFCYYFDIICRQMISYKRHNIVENHIIDLSVVYSFSHLNLLIKPLVIAIGLYFIFILLKMFSRACHSESPKTSVKKVKRNFTVESITLPIPTVTKKKNKKMTKQKQF